jgi:serine/threonine-protein kinase HipA
MELDVWLGNLLVANVREKRKNVYVQYTDGAAARYGPEVPLLSCSLPTPGPARTDNSRAFLEGLLPEGTALQAMAAQVRGVSLTATGVPQDPTDSVLLLGEFGRECAGAVSTAPVGFGWTPGPGRYDPLDAAGLERLVADLPTNPLGADPGAGRRMSLAGAQPKLVLARFDGRWHEPADGAASTHILKPTRGWPLSADNEAAVMSMARYVGLTDSAAWAEQVGPGRVYVVERYDRLVRSHGVVDRLHQEDLCQALGLRPAEKYKVGRPSQRIARVLRTYSADPEADLTTLLRHLTFRTVVGDEDGHGKNVSLMLDEGRVRLAPLYDSLCTMSYGELDGKMGAGIGNQVSLFEVDRQALVAEGEALGLPQQTVTAVVDDTAERIRDALGRLDGLDLEEQAIASVTKITQSRVANLLGGKPMGAAPAGTALGGPGQGRSSAVRLDTGISQ